MARARRVNPPKKRSQVGGLTLKLTLAQADELDGDVARGLMPLSLWPDVKRLIRRIAQTKTGATMWVPDRSTTLDRLIEWFDVCWRAQRAAGRADAWERVEHEVAAFRDRSAIVKLAELA